MPTDKNRHLECVLDSHKAAKETALLDKYEQKKKGVVAALKERYGSNLYEPFLAGSFAKRTSINLKFDFDLMAPFKRNAFATLEDMYTSVYGFLCEKYKDEATVRRQKVSIGIDFHADSDGHTVKIDVVPGRELNLNQYSEDNQLNLYVYSQFGNIRQGSDRLKSNVKAQIHHIRQQADKDFVRQNVRLLKVWKLYGKKDPKSFFLELITIRAFSDKDIAGGLWEKLKAVMEYIRDNVERVALPDPGNQSNNMADTLTDVQKRVLSQDMKYMIDQIEANSDMIKNYFPLNLSHPCPSEKNTPRYGVREAAVSVPPLTRFG